MLKYEFGSTLREIRLRRGLSLKEVSEKAGVSESLVSQIERNKVSPSIDSLFSLAEVLELDFDYLFRSHRKNKDVDLVKKAERQELRRDGIIYRRLSTIEQPTKENSIEAMELEIPVGKKRGNLDYGHVGLEMGIILEGEAVLSYGTKHYALEAGDSISFSSDIPHMLYNKGAGTLKALWIISPPRIKYIET